MRLLPLAAALALPLTLSACFGGKTPSSLLTLTPATPSATFERTAAASEAITIELPIAGRDIRQVRAEYLQDWLSDAEAPLTWRLQKDRAGSGAPA